jgi:hypothetical protein
MVRRRRGNPDSGARIFVYFFVPQMADMTKERYSGMRNRGYRLRTGESADESREIFAALPCRPGRAVSPLGKIQLGSG